MPKPTAYQGKRLRPLLASTAETAASAEELGEGAAPAVHSHAQADVTGLVAALAGLQPLDSDLTAIAALTTTTFGRGLLELANAAALRTAAGIATGQTYTPSNVSADRSYDANATTLDEIADVLGTLIADLQTAGIIL